MIGEKVQKNKGRVLKQIGINRDCSILNMEFFKDTSQVNITLQTRGEDPLRKLKKMAVVVPEEKIKDLKDQLWSLVYPYFEYSQAELSLSDKFIKIQEAKEDEAEKELVKEKEKQDSKILKIKADSMVKIEELKKSITKENSMKIMKEIDKEEKKLAGMIQKENECFDKKAEELKEKKRLEAEKIIQVEKDKLKKDYDIL